MKESCKNEIFGELPQDANKVTRGRVLIIAGMNDMAGAGIMATMGALKSGAGLVKACTSRGNFPVFLSRTPEAIMTEFEGVKHSLTDFKAIAFGPGMGKGSISEQILEYVIDADTCPLVIDADGLNIISENDNLVQKLILRKNKAVITPHWGEAARLLGNIDGMTREDVVRKLHYKTGSVAVLKGPGTLVFDGGTHVYKNETGNPGMAKGGAGDVLTGIITSLIGQGNTLMDSVAAGVFVHGMAGDLAAEDIGQYGMTAMDIAGYVPEAIKKIQK